MISVRGAPERSVSYGQLQGGRPFARQISGTAPLKRPQEYRVVGSDARRVDLAGKFTGAPSFVHDLRLPGMLHGRVVRARQPGARVLAVDESAVRDARVIRLGNFIGVVAEREEQAIKAAEQLQVTWEETADLPPMERLYDWMRAQPATEHVDRGVGRRRERDARRGKARARRLRAALPGACFHWTVVRGGRGAGRPPDGLGQLGRGLSACAARWPICWICLLERIRVIHMEGAGAYGQNGSEDVAADAALLAREVGRPVRVQWSRRDEFIGEPKAAPMVMEVTAGLDDDGRIVAWRYEVWSPVAHQPAAHGAGAAGGTRDARAGASTGRGLFHGRRAQRAHQLCAAQPARHDTQPRRAAVAHLVHADAGRRGQHLRQ